MTIYSPYSDALAYRGTATRRREMRQKVRNILGTSRDQAPSARRTLDALVQLDHILRDATAGAMRVTIHVGTDELSVIQARDRVAQALAEIELRYEPRPDSLRRTGHSD